jgi:hypothetical protein
MTDDRQFTIQISANASPVVLEFPGASTSQAATTGDFRSHQTGNWSATVTWEYYNGSAWVTPAPSAPTGAGTITIQSGHAVTVDGAVSISGTLVNSGSITPTSTLTFTSGGQYQHNFTTTAALDRSRELLIGLFSPQMPARAKSPRGTPE